MGTHDKNHWESIYKQKGEEVAHGSKRLMVLTAKTERFRVEVLTVVSAILPFLFHCCLFSSPTSQIICSR